jgi:hypothetical protein
MHFTRGAGDDAEAYEADYERAKTKIEKVVATHDAEVRQEQADHDAVRIDDLTARLAAAERLLAEQGEPEWEYRYAEIYPDATYTYGPKGDPDRSFATAAEAQQARVDDSDVVLRRRKAGPWLPVEENTPHTEGNER